MAKYFEAVEINSYITGSSAKVRKPVDAISLTNVDLSTDLSGATIGGLVVAAGNRVLLAGQTTSTQGGVYQIFAGAGNTIRAPDFVADTLQVEISCLSGTYANTVWQILSASAGSAFSAKMLQNLNYPAGSLFYSTASTIEYLATPSTNSILQFSGSTPSWIDSNIVTGGYSVKQPCRFDTISNITNLASVDTTSTVIFDIGAATIVNGDRILVRSQTNPIQNGIYTVSSAGATAVLTRSADGVDPYIHPGDTIVVQKTGYMWIISGTSAITVGTDAINFATDVNARADFCFTTDIIKVNGTSYLDVAWFSYNIAKYGASRSAQIIYESDVLVDMQVYNNTGSTALVTASTNGFTTQSFTTPAVNSRISLRFKKNTATASIYGIQLVLL